MPDLTKLRYESVKKEDAHAQPDLGDYADVDRNLWKSLLIGFLTTLFAVTFSFIVKDFFFYKAFLKLTDFQYVILAGVIGAFFAAFFFLQAIFTKGFARLNVMALINAAGLLGPFYDHFSRNAAIVSVLIYLALLFAAYSGWRELSLLLRIKFARLARRVLPGVMTALALFVSLVFYINISEGRTNIVTRDLLSSLIFAPAEKIAVRFVPEFSFSKTPNEIFTELATNQLDETAGAEQLSSAARKMVIDKSVAESKKKLASMIAYPIDMDSRISDTIFEYLVMHITGPDSETKSIVGLSAGILAFITLKFLGIFVAIAAGIIGFLFFEMCVAMNFITVVLESRTREIIILK